MIVLPVCVETGSRSQRGVRRRRTCIPQGSGCSNQHDSSPCREAHFHTQRNIQHRQHRNGTERCTDTHGNHQTDNHHHHGSNQLASAHDAERRCNQLFHRTGGIHYIGETGSHQHDEGNQSHDGQTVCDNLIQISSLHGTEYHHDRDAGQCAQRQRISRQINHQSSHCSNKSYPVSRLHTKIFASCTGGSICACKLQCFIVTRLAEHKQCKHQANHHGSAQRPGILPHISHFHGHAVCSQIVRNQTMEDPAEAEGQRDIRCLQTKCQSAGRTAAVQIHFIHQRQQCRNQNGNESDVYRNQVLGTACNHGQRHQQQGLAGTYETGDFAGQNLRNTSVCHAGSQNPQQNITQRGLCIAAHSRNQHVDGFADTHACGHTGHQGRNQKGQQHINL